ncbi:MAG: tRNA 2-thiouridine(34) synthase MnmA [Bacteroidales bacterium]|nr:tRNA 2-thiouridine(34) synthase MnmA [Bacteroidales bacterium]
MNIAALVSGGVDSSVVVHLLKEGGVTPDIFYIRIGMEDEDGYIGCPAEEDIEITSWLARHYGCRMEVVDLHREYWDRVVSYTIDTVRRGLTPNPDVMCNKLIKFGAFDDRCGAAYDAIATGHYARTATVEAGGREVAFLASAADPVKDQTDFLSQLDYRQISRLRFPIGGMMKSEVRRVAADAGLPSATRKDSQGICFLGKIDYNSFLRRYLGEREGPIVELESGRVLGSHRGYWFHTIGQRKGLLLGGGPWFVVRKDIEANTLYVSHGYEPAAAYGREVRLAGFHWLSADLGLSDVKFKIRHTPEFHQGHLEPAPDGEVLLHSDDPLQGIAAGQYATVYDNDAHLVVATGMIV